MPLTRKTRYCTTVIRAPSGKKRSPIPMKRRRWPKYILRAALTMEPQVRRRSRRRGADGCHRVREASQSSSPKMAANASRTGDGFTTSAVSKLEPVSTEPPTLDSSITMTGITRAAATSTGTSFRFAIFQLRSSTGRSSTHGVHGLPRKTIGPLRRSLPSPRYAPVAQRIEQRFPKPRAQVRFLPGASQEPLHLNGFSPRPARPDRRSCPECVPKPDADAAPTRPRRPGG
jgi:hypothetical protein